VSDRTHVTDASSLDVGALRARFPALARTHLGRPCVFADAPAGTQVPREVIAAMASYLERSNANTDGAFDTSRETDALIAAARGAAADLLGAGSDEIVFGQNTTTLAFAFSRAVGRTLRPGVELLVTRLDHDANVAPWLAVAEDTGATLRWVDIRTDDCTLDLGSLAGTLSARTKVVAFTLASNAVGTITPASGIVRLAHEAGAIAVCDGVHFVPHRLADFHGLDADVLFCSAYKFFGPHLGVMAARAEVLDSLRPYRVRPAHDRGPEAWETGTLSHEALAGLVAAVDYLGSLSGEATDRRSGLLAGMRAVEAHERTITERFLSELPAVPGARLFGIADPARAGERTPTFALRQGDRHPRESAETLAREGIFVWDGNYYALEIMERLGLEATGGAVRIGFCHYHTLDEVDRVLDALRGSA
jgi:cysteine desulfurase family protein (TIGR01976 family)